MKPCPPGWSCVCCKDTSPPPFLYCSLWTEVTMHGPCLKSGGLCSTLLRAKYLCKLCRILLGKSIYSHLFSYSIMYLYWYWLPRILGNYVSHSSGTGSHISFYSSLQITFSIIFIFSLLSFSLPLTCFPTPLISLCLSSHPFPWISYPISPVVLLIGQLVTLHTK